MPNQPYDRRAGFHRGPRHNGNGAADLPRLDAAVRDRPYHGGRQKYGIKFKNRSHPAVARHLTRCPALERKTRTRRNERGAHESLGWRDQIDQP